LNKSIREADFKRQQAESHSTFERKKVQGTSARLGLGKKGKSFQKKKNH